MQSPVPKGTAAAAVLTILLTIAGCASTGGVAKIQAERLGTHAVLVTALGGELDEPANGLKDSDTLPAHGKGAKGKAAASPSGTSAASAAATAPAAVVSKPSAVKTATANATAPAAATE